MADDTSIEWTQATWNPWHGCIKVSTGCKHCYMYREKRRYGQNPRIVVRGKTTFDAPLKWTASRLIFTCSWSDWFVQEADEWRDEAWDIIRRSHHHTFQILTKRPERIKSHLPPDWGEGWDNVWLGVSIESQEFVERMELLSKVPAHLRFISAEPLLGPLNLGSLKGVHWLITGGESGPNARPMDMAWVRSIRDQCLRAGVAFFHKQNGGWRKVAGTWGGRVVDGRTWNEMPSVGNSGSVIALPSGT